MYLRIPDSCNEILATRIKGLLFQAYTTISDYESINLIDNQSIEYWKRVLRDLMHYNIVYQYNIIQKN